MWCSHVTKFTRGVVVFAVAAILSLTTTRYALAQNTFGSLSNFNVFNDTGNPRL